MAAPKKKKSTKIKRCFLNKSKINNYTNITVKFDKKIIFFLKNL